MANPFPVRGHWTADIPSQLPDDTHLPEVIDGQLHLIYANQYSHSLALWSLAKIVAPFAWGLNFQFVPGPKPFRLAPKSQGQPDLMAHPRWRKHPSHASAEPTGPELFVEVAMPYSREVDLGLKQRLYAQHYVYSYWVVDYVSREVLVWKAGDWSPRVATESLQWQPRRSDRALTIDLLAYFDAVPEFDVSHDGSARWICRIIEDVDRGEVSSSQSTPEVPGVRHGFILVVDTLCQGIIPGEWDDESPFVLYDTREEAETERADFAEMRADAREDAHMASEDEDDTDDLWVEVAELHPDVTLVLPELGLIFTTDALRDLRTPSPRRTGGD